MIFKIGPNRIVYSRSVYTTLDWLGDVGGLLDALRLIGMFLCAIYTFIRGDLLTYFLLNKLFKKVRHRNRSNNETDTIKEKITDIQNREPFTLRSKFCNCMRKRKEKRLLDKGIEKAFKELEVDRFIKAQI